MSDWIKQHLGMTVDDATLLVTLLGMFVAIVTFLWRKRAAVGRAKDRFDLASGRTRRRYARWFLATHGTLRNIYSDIDERLDLRDTYVPLSFAVPTANSQEGERATDVLADKLARRLMILGNAGTGKSTLLRAFGAGILRLVRESGSSDLKTVARTQETPFLVSLRDFAYYAPGPRSLSRYLTEQVLPGAGIRRGQAFLRRLLVRDQCLVMLDGLDEVPPDHFQQVRRAVYEFAESTDDALPTKRARLVMSCREQNYLAMSDDWSPLFPTARTHTLAPLRTPRSSATW